MINRLSSGIRINSAADDAANLSLSKKIDSTNRGLKVANNNIQTGITRLQMMDGYLNNLSNSLHRMRDLAVQGANGVYADNERAMINQEAQVLMGEIKQGTQIANNDIQGVPEGELVDGIVQLTEEQALDAGYTKIIKTASDLSSVGMDDKCILMNDIDFSNFDTGGASVINGAFNGELNGNGYTISNLTINGGSNDGIGLISSTSNSAEVKNIALENVNISGHDDIGGIVGNSKGNIENSYARGTVSGEDRLGILVGNNSGGNISNCYTSGNVSGVQFNGGLVGISDGEILNSFSTANVSASGEYTGGLSGGNFNGAKINHSYATGNVSGKNHVGGLAGHIGQGASIDNSYATGNVTGNSNVGGLVGVNIVVPSPPPGSIKHSYATGFVSGNSNVGGFIGINQGTIDSTNFWNTDIMETGVGSGTISAQGLTTEQIATDAVSVLGSEWTSNGITAHQKVFNKSMSMQIGADADSAITYDNIRVNTNFSVNLSNSQNSKASMNILDNAINYISSERANLGSRMNTLESMMDSNSTRSEELTQSTSTIRDTDMAYEASKLAKNQIITQSAVSILQQAQNFNGNIILSLY